jgi:DNA replication and repair protein RecF
MNPFFVSRIFAHQFRNLEAFELDAHPRLNILYGDNGQGKTNIIEAISVALSTKTLRPVKLTADLITHGKEEGRIEVGSAGEGCFEASAHLFMKGKKHELFGKPLKDYATLFERVAVVSFVPDELQIVHASASHRRRALNQIAAGFFPTYIGLYRRFEKALVSRNQLLKAPFCDPNELAAFNQIYASLAAEITLYRKEAVALWTPYFLTSVKDIVGDSFQVGVEYEASSLTEASAVSEQLRELAREEGFRRATLCGPHLDDLAFTIDGVDARFDASRGQARAIVLALKLGQLNAISKTRNTPTILLLDDVTGELDPLKVEHLLSTVADLNIQTFLTTTHLSGLFGLTDDCAVFEVENGRANKLAAPQNVD